YRDKIVASLGSTATVPQDELDTFGKRLGNVLLDGVACHRPKIDAGSVRNPRQQGLRVLLVVSREAGDTVVPLEEMTAARKRKFEGRMAKAGVEFEVRPGGRVAALSDAVTDPPTPWDVVQYLGHGELRETPTGKSVGGLRLVGNGTSETFL